MARKKSVKTGLPPGTLVHVGKKSADKPVLHVFDYNEKVLEEKTFTRVEDAFAYRDKKTVSWINITGIHDLGLIEKMGEHFGIHPLIQEDIVNTGGRAKIEEHEDFMFIVLKMLAAENTGELESEQVSIIITRTCVISFQEREGDVFDGLRSRIRSESGRIRKRGADYLAYALIDSIVDEYFNFLEGIGERVEEVENELMGDPGEETLGKIQGLKKDMISVRRTIWPLREVIHGLERADSELISDSINIYLRDVYDHTIQVMDTTEGYRDLISGMLDTYLSTISNRMNEIMKTLTIIATIFIPLTFIAGIYGMNFNPDASPLNMPELNWYWGYPTAWAVMIIVAIIMLSYFKRKKWL